MQILENIITSNSKNKPCVYVCVCVKWFISDWDLNLAKTYGLPTYIAHLVSGPNEAQVLNVSLQKEFSERQSDR